MKRAHNQPSPCRATRFTALNAAIRGGGFFRRVPMRLLGDLTVAALIAGTVAFVLPAQAESWLALTYFYSPLHASP